MIYINILIIGKDFKLKDLTTHLSSIKNIQVTLLNHYSEELIKISYYNLYIIEIDENKKNWISTVKLIRETSKTPIILILNKPEEHTQLLAHTLNVNWFVTKPFSVNYLVKISIKYLNEYNLNYYLKDLSLIKRTRIFLIKDIKISFTKKEFNIIYFLIKNKENILTRDFILDNIWGIGNGNTRLLDTHMKNIRKKLNIYSKHIITTRSFGYYWTEFPF